MSSCLHEPCTSLHWRFDKVSGRRITRWNLREMRFAERFCLKWGFFIIQTWLQLRLWIWLLCFVRSRNSLFVKRLIWNWNYVFCLYVQVNGSRTLWESFKSNFFNFRNEKENVCHNSSTLTVTVNCTCWNLEAKSEIVTYEMYMNKSMTRFTLVF